MKVYVVMGNDYPEAVYDTEKAAQAFCDQKKKEQGAHLRIYWRQYEFELKTGE